MDERTNAKKIAFEGAICTGKTTIFQHYQNKYLDDTRIVFVKEAGTEYLQANPTVDYQSSKGVSEGIQALAHRKELSAHTTDAETIICDRSVFSAVVYEWAHGNKREATRLFKLVEHWLPTYTSILLFDPTHVPYIANDIRRSNAEERDYYHNTYASVFGQLQVRYDLICGNYQDRLQAIDKILA